MGDRILVGTRKGTFLVEKSGGAWKARLAGHPGVGVNFVARDPGRGTLWAALGHGHWGAKLSRSSDDGETWEDAPQITYPEGARYLAPPDPTAEDQSGPHRLVDATLAKLWVLAFGPGGRMFVGTIPGGLFESDDGGESFELNRPLWNHESRGGDLFDGDGEGKKTHWSGTPASEGPEFAAGVHSVVMDPTDPEHYYVAVSSGGVIETRDGGRSWEGRNKGMTNDYMPDGGESDWGHDPHFVEVCAAHPNHLWQQNHCGIFYSTDGAATWRKVSAPDQGMHFGFPIAADAEDGKTAWVVPGKGDFQRMAIDGKLFVGRTQDGGETWEALSEGLPQEGAYDVVYRHALHNSGDTLAFGSTTGNLYVSEDRGESWQAVSQNLPPIYSVRFG